MLMTLGLLGMFLATFGIVYAVSEDSTGYLTSMGVFLLSLAITAIGGALNETHQKPMLPTVVEKKAEPLTIATDKPSNYFEYRGSNGVFKIEFSFGIGLAKGKF